MVACAPGSTVTAEGPAALILTENAVALCGPQGVIQAIHLTDIKDVDVCRLEGVLIERQTEVGPVLTQPTNNYGVEITWNTPSITGRLRVMVFFANTAYQWVALIRDAAIGRFRRDSGAVQITFPDE
jgi:hypothetical protein